MDDRPVLSVIISTYNRSGLVCANLKQMLKCKSEKIEFIVGDNASEDDTLEQLYLIQDSRVRVYSNKNNYDILNIWLLSLYAKGKYFVCVNDRDYIEPYGLGYIVEKLEEIETCEFVVNWIKPGVKEGYYTGKFIPEFQVEFRHPGTLIYLTEWAVKYITEEVRQDIINNMYTNSHWKIYFAWVCNAQIVYFLDKEFLKQPSNVNTIPVQRKEAVGEDEMYLSPRAVTFWYLLFLDERIKWLDYPLINEYSLLQYVRYLEDTTITYFIYMNRKDFAERYGYTHHSANEWFKNGMIFSKNIIFSGKVKNKKLLMKMVLVTIKVYINTLINVVVYCLRN